MKQKKITPWLLAMPVLGGTLAFFAVPFAACIYYSFLPNMGNGNAYINILQNEAFILAFSNTAKFIAVGVPLNLITAFLCALILQKILYRFTFFKTIILFPLTVPIATTVALAQVFLQKNGIINTFLLKNNLPIINWLDGSAAFWVLMLIYLWKNCGYTVILFLAGLNTIPKHLYEAAQIDGAGTIKQIFKITLPMLVPTAFFAFLMAIINSFKSYREAFLLGGLYPHKSIYMLQHYLNNNFANLNYGNISAASIIMFFIILIVVLLLYILQNNYCEEKM